MKSSTSTWLRATLTALMAVLFALQPAIAGGAECASELFRGSCSCAVETSIEAPSCCMSDASETPDEQPSTQAAEGASDVDTARDEGRQCACELGQLPASPASKERGDGSSAGKHVERIALASLEACLATPIAFVDGVVRRASLSDVVPRACAAPLRLAILCVARL